jgi:hypothetical protein
MTVVANLVARITADSRGFQQGIGGAKSALSSLGALLPAVSVGAVGAFVKSTIDGADALRDMAIRTNTSTEFLSQMQYAAGQTGVRFETLTASLTRMQSNLVQISRSDKALDVLAQMGIDVKAILALDPEQQFLAIGAALESIQDPALRTNAAIKLFGRSGAELTQLFAEGAGGIAAMRAEADRFGVTIGTGAADAADRANDALGRLKAAFAGLTGGLVREYLPAIADFVELFARGVPIVLGLIGGGVRSVGQIAGGLAAAGASALRGNFAGAGAILSGLPADLADNFDDLSGETKSQTDVLRSIDRNIQRGVPAVAQ